MKTTKLIAVAIILGIASLGFAQKTTITDQAPNQEIQSVVIKLSKAIQMPDLVAALRAQVTRDILEQDKPMYTVRVTYKHSVVFVSGTYAEWKKFLSNDHADVDSGAKSGLIPFSRALRDANLVRAMRAQLTPSLLQGEKRLYIASVRYKHSIVYVSGTLIQWQTFFSIHPDGPAGN